ncbi:transaldolase [Bailinhaonella thermotolerans]|uniref:Transaldolase n=1 Tax=Bailinhaonella thermotolerans TaxID=1070861 RepID=A0A3A4BB09_9ACTN|nr:transaldolase [Bailinhaonella thermotolerans]RJL36119.1 transaldolase [Bailinhaonella thermotolerans]
MSEILKRLSDEGVAIWLDDLSRDRIRTGNLAELVRDKHVVGVTTNPTIFATALSKGTAYDEQIKRLSGEGVTVDEAILSITTDDVRDACDVMRPAFDASGGRDGRVSIEVDPRLARDTQKTIDEARTLWDLVGRENLFIKIPATLEGLPAITAVLAQGISVNVTLIFSLERYGAVIDAYFAGLEQAKANGHDLSKIQSVASFFVSRVDTEVDKRLSAIGGHDDLRGKAALANARLAYELYEQKFAGERWEALQAAGANPQRPLWASTGVKDPSLPDTLYVDELVVEGVVNTMPEKTLNAVADHGKITGDTVHGTYDEARALLGALAGIGVEYDDVVRVLEDEGVDKFEASWKELLDTVTKQLEIHHP